MRPDIGVIVNERDNLLLHALKSVPLFNGPAFHEVFLHRSLVACLRGAELFDVVPEVHLKLAHDASILLHVLVEVRQCLIGHGTLLESHLVTEERIGDFGIGGVAYCRIIANEPLDLAPGQEVTNVHRLTPRQVSRLWISHNPPDDLLDLLAFLSKRHLLILDEVSGAETCPGLLDLHVFLPGLVQRLMPGRLSSIFSTLRLGKRVELLCTDGCCDQVNDMVVTPITQPRSGRAELLLDHAPRFLGAVGHVVDHAPVEKNHCATGRVRQAPPLCQRLPGQLQDAVLNGHLQARHLILKLSPGLIVRGTIFSEVLPHAAA
mmetsp:Transcript_41391/g.96181  ORF Transcript_41391/g.96181 Transcript_41391/m.96181 type:complete len:319 (-) Transcript_41391:397-1353(-)